MSTYGVTYEMRRPAPRIGRALPPDRLDREQLDAGQQAGGPDHDRNLLPLVLEAVGVAPTRPVRASAMSPSTSSERWISQPPGVCSSVARLTST